MKTEKLGQEPIVPTIYRKIGENEYRVATHKDTLDSFATLTHTEGMSKRFYAACAAMQGILANRGAYYQANSRNDPSENLGGELPEYCAKIAFQFADELLKQENND